MLITDTNVPRLMNKMGRATYRGESYLRYGVFTECYNETIIKREIQ